MLIVDAGFQARRVTECQHCVCASLLKLLIQNCMAAGQLNRVNLVNIRHFAA